MARINFTPPKTLECLDMMFSTCGYKLRIVGGAVRDLIQRQEPKDIDLCTDATPDQMLAIPKTFPWGVSIIPTGLQHGTLTFVIDGDPYEVTTLRIDTDTDGRHANVEFTTDFEKDAARRDLTINSMSMDFEGNIFDYFGGYEDLQDNMVRFVGDAETRIQEDYLRILRFFRFIARMGASVPTENLEAIKRHVSGLKQISRERVWAEMSKLLVSRYRWSAMQMMDEHGILPHIGMSDISRYGHDFLKLADDAITALSCYIDIDAEEFARSWKMSADEIRKLVWMVDHKFEVPFQHSIQDYLVNGVNRNWIISWVKLDSNAELIELAETWKVPEFPVKGQDLLDMGFEPGKQVGITLASMKRAWMSSRFILTKEDLLCLVQTVASHMKEGQVE